MNKRSVLITGGAGYIGSHMAKMLTSYENRVVILDNLSTGHVEMARFGRLVVGDLADEALLDQLFRDNSFDVVMHFAASSLVGESMDNPAKYYRNNISCTINLLDAMVKHSVKSLVFSSSAAIFGNPKYTPIDENHVKDPINPYGTSKLVIEKILKDYSVAYGLNSISLRYFNACGADPDGILGEMHIPETHLIPLVMQAASGRRSEIKIFGTDYPTPDGTCVRDYIHVIDLCNAHRLAMNKLGEKGFKGSDAFNLGNEVGISIRDIVLASEKLVAANGKKIKVVEVGRRPGDPAVLIANSKRAQVELGWSAKLSDLPTIVSHAWNWEKELVLHNV